MALLYIRNYSGTRDTYISLCTTLSLRLLGSTRFTSHDTRTNYYFARPDSAGRVPDIFADAAQEGGR